MEIVIIFINKYKLLALNVEGYISKRTNATQLLTTINAIVSSEKVYSLITTQQEPIDYNERDSFRIKHKLTNREIEIITLIKKGKTSKNTIRELYLSEFTVETHRKYILKKIM